MKITPLIGIGILLLVIGFVVAFFAGGELISSAILTMTYAILTNMLPNIHILQIISAITTALVCIVSGGSLIFFEFPREKKANKEKLEYIWTAKREEVKEEDFEETRRCLLNSYHSYVQTHAGYIIALIIGLFALISTFKSFFGYGSWGIGVFGFLIFLIVMASGFMGFRIIYWSILASAAITIPIAQAIDCFNEYNRAGKAYLTKAPNTEIIQMGIKKVIQKDLDENIYPFWKRWAIKTAGKSF